MEADRSFWARQLPADPLARQSFTDELRARADRREWFAQQRLIDYSPATLPAEQGSEEELRPRADAGNPRAARELAVQLGRTGQLDEPRMRADEPSARTQLYRLPAGTGRLDELETIAAGDVQAAAVLVDVLAEQGRMSGLVTRASAGYAARKVWSLLPDPSDGEDRPDW